MCSVKAPRFSGLVFVIVIEMLLFENMTYVSIPKAADAKAVRLSTYFSVEKLWDLLWCLKSRTLSQSHLLRLS